MKKIFICQSNYLPWWGYFWAIGQADAFVLYDEVQYTRRDWRNRNLLKTARGKAWISIPTEAETYGQTPINAVRIAADWQNRHLNLWKENYRKAPFFDQIFPFLAKIYEETADFDHLSAVNHLFLKKIAAALDIKTPFFESTEFEKNLDFEPQDPRSARLLEICRQLGATEYLSGAAAKSYLDVDLFQKYQISVSWIAYPPTPQYPQQFGDFDGQLSVVDMLFNWGFDQTRFFLDNLSQNS